MTPVQRDSSSFPSGVPFDPETMVWLADGRIARSELDEWDCPVMVVLTPTELRAEAAGRRERRRVERLAAETYRIRKAALYARMKRNLSPSAFKEWVYRHSLGYAVKKAWTAEKVQSQFYAENFTSPGPLPRRVGDRGDHQV